MRSDCGYGWSRRIRRIRPRRRRRYQNIAYIKAAHAAKATGAGARSIGRIYSRMTELVVPGAFILVGQHLIGFINLFKFGFGFFITGI